jgi:hypothetical protein
VKVQTSPQAIKAKPQQSAPASLLDATESLVEAVVTAGQDSVDQTAIDNARLAIASSQGATPPLPGQYWPEQQGWYAGIQRSEDGLTSWHLILLDAPECYFEDVEWGKYGKKIKGADFEFDGLANTIAMAEAGNELAQRIRALPGDCYLPSRFESALLYATVRAQIKTGDWYWTSTQTSAYDAWMQHFSHGGQYLSDKSSTGRARAVRRLIL